MQKRREFRRVEFATRVNLALVWTRWKFDVEFKQMTKFRQSFCVHFEAFACVKTPKFS
ncbi:hypothetical protein [uncultured Campylobacter sp.]|uniref:hypothetical protein n=1 Tax=uncultured Campylobacter sp. TaxID=218934 RepID=UPI0028E8AA0A|nr:hypothetical protein [uncultured Campylobacter sp.]